VYRRSFLKTAAATGATAAVAAVDLAGCRGAAPATPEAACASFPHADLEEATVADLAGRMKRGELSAVDLVDRYVARIEAIDRRGPRLKSVLELDPDARSIAAGLDEERRTRGVRGPLHGIPVLVKDNIDTAGRTKTTAGSLALANAAPPADAEIVARLRRAGAIVLGKTNLSEWANIRSSRSTSGWSARGGLTRNPYALDRNASGSSSGSGAAIAANLAAVALGSETDGSIVSPASICGIVGMKPTIGLVSRGGIIPIAESQDTAGPMTRSVTDAALVLAAIAGPDPRDRATEAQRGRPIADYVAALRPDAARGKRIGVVRNFPTIARSVMDIVDRTVDDLRKLGAMVIDPVEIASMSKLDDPELEVLLYELKAGLASYLGARAGAPMKSLDEIVRYNREHAAEELRYFGQEIFEKALDKGPLTTPAYLEARASCVRLARDEGIDLALRKHGVDLLLAPTGGPAWITDLVNGDSFTGSSSTIAAVAGYPSITVPAGMLRGLPIGVSFFGPAWSEPLLLGVAYAYEQATRHRQKPRYLPTLGGLAPDGPA
jgi:amidase